MTRCRKRSSPSIRRPTGGRAAGRRARPRAAPGMPVPLKQPPWRPGNPTRVYVDACPLTTPACADRDNTARQPGRATQRLRGPRCGHGSRSRSWNSAPQSYSKQVASPPLHTGAALSERPAVARTSRGPPTCNPLVLAQHRRHDRRRGDIAIGNARDERSFPDFFSRDWERALPGCVSESEQIDGERQVNPRREIHHEEVVRPHARYHP